MELPVSELDETFGEQMNRLSDKRHQEAIRQRRYWLNNDICRYFICLLGQFCQVDLYGGRQIESPDPRWAFKEQFDQRFSSAHKNRWLSPLFMTLFVFSAIRLGINTYFQYVYDYHLLRYDRFKLHWLASASSIQFNSSGVQQAPAPVQQHSAAAPPPFRAHEYLASAATTGRNSGLPFDYETQLIRNVETARETLRSIGSPYLNLNFVIQIVYVLIILSSFTLMLVMRFYYSRIAPFDFSLVRAMLDLRTELRVCNRLIRNEINKFIGSSRNFTQACIEQSKQFAKEHLFYKHKLEQIYAMAELRRFLLDHHLTIKTLEQMALNGALMPCNRTPDWIAKVTHYMCLFSLLSIGLFLLVVFFFAAAFFIIFNVELQMSALDLLVVAEAGVLVTIMVIAGVFYFSITVINSIDQIYFATKICEQMMDCIMQNQKKFYTCFHASYRRDFAMPDRAPELESEPASSPASPVEPDNQGSKRREEPSPNVGQPNNVNVDHLLASKQADLVQSNSCHTQMNSDLLEVFMLYKIFAAQMRPITKTIGSFGLACLVLMVLTPINVRLHVPYFDRAIKVYAMFFSLLCTTIGDLSLVPTCYMFARCINLYRCLSSLLAHAIEITSHPNAGRIYDMHTIWLLRKELNHPERLVSQFTIIVLGLRITYSSLLRIHFWVGLISLSIVIDTNSSQLEFFGSLFSDPFGILD